MREKGGPPSAPPWAIVSSDRGVKAGMHIPPRFGEGWNAEHRASRDAGSGGEVLDVELEDASAARRESGRGPVQVTGKMRPGGMSCVRVKELVCSEHGKLRMKRRRLGRRRNLRAEMVDERTANEEIAIVEGNRWKKR